MLVALPQESDMERFKVGDAVLQSIDGPSMTVISVGDHTPSASVDSVLCVWFSQGQMSQGHFEHAMLQPSPTGTADLV